MTCPRRLALAWKEVPIEPGKVRLQTGGEAFNFLNHLNISFVGSAIDPIDFAVVGRACQSRRVQLAVKLIF